MDSFPKHPGQAVKIITESTGEHKIVRDDSKTEVCTEQDRPLKSSRSLSNFEKVSEEMNSNNGRPNNTLKECKSCDENLIKFIFTKHGIQVISDVETIV